MNEDRTPLEVLDEAVRAFTREALDDSGSLSAWVLGVQTNVITGQSGVLPLVFSSYYAMGPSTSPEAAIGLLRFTEARLTSTFLAE